MQAKDEAVRKEFEALYQKSAQLQKAKDLNAWADLLTRDWTTTQPGSGLHTREEVMKIMPLYFDTVVSFDEISLTITKLTVEGNQAVAVVDVKLISTDRDPEGQFGAKGEIHQIECTTTVEDTWLKTAAGWRQKAHVKLIPNQLLVDGKPFEPETGAPKQEASS